MVAAITLLLACQLAGELLVRLAGLPVPGPVAGLCLLAAGLAWRGRAWPALTQAADAILKNLSLLFVPAGVGIVRHAGRLAEDGPAVVLAVLVSTVLAMAVTAGVFRLVARLQGEEGER